MARPASARSEVSRGGRAAFDDEEEEALERAAEDARAAVAAARKAEARAEEARAREEEECRRAEDEEATRESREREVRGARRAVASAASKRRCFVDARLSSGCCRNHSGPPVKPKNVPPLSRPS